MSDKMTDAAAQVSAASVKIRSRQPGEQVKVSTLEKLDKAMEREELVVTLENTKTGEDENIIFRYPTPGEISMIEGSLLSTRVLRELVDAGGDEEKISEENLNETIDSVTNPANMFQRQVLMLSICAIEPPGIDYERVNKWDPEWVEAIYVELMKRRNTPTVVDGFHSVDSTTGERGSGTTRPKNGGKKQ